MDSPLFYQLGEAFTGRNKWKERQNKYAADLAGMTTAAQMDAQLASAEKGRDMLKKRALGEFGTMGMSPEAAAQAYARAASSGLLTDATTALKAEGYMPSAKQVGAAAGEADVIGNQARGAKSWLERQFDTGAAQGAEEAGRTKTKADIAKNRFNQVSDALKEAGASWKDEQDKARDEASLQALVEQIVGMTTANKMEQQKLAEFTTPEAVKSREAMTTAQRLTAEDVPNQLKANAAWRQSTAEFNRARAQAMEDPDVKAAYGLITKNPMSAMQDPEVIMQQAIELANRMKQRAGGTNAALTTAVQGDNAPRPVTSGGRTPSGRILNP